MSNKILVRVAFHSCFHFLVLPCQYAIRFTLYLGFSLQIIEVVCCKLTSLQSDLYNHFIHSKNVGNAIRFLIELGCILLNVFSIEKSARGVSDMTWLLFGCT